MIDVTVIPCADYAEQNINSALTEALAPFGFLESITSGMIVGIKANLVAPMKPETAAVTHPALIATLVRMLKERGAEVIVGDSPGGLFTHAYLSSVYRTAGMSVVEEAGAKLNDDFGSTTVSYPDAKVLKMFTYTSWLDKCDVIVDFCKLKSHGMMGLSAAAKNLFGVIPGTTKPEYHFRFPNHRDFSAMIVDIDEYFKPVISICDAIEGMEGNGPTAGTPRHIGVILASKSPHKLDLAAAKLIGLGIKDVPTLNDAYERGFIPDTADKLSLNRDISSYIIHDYKNMPNGSLLFDKKSKLFGKIAKKALESRPDLKSRECVGCGKCAAICPAHAIEIKEKKAIINRSLCIRCFCCQEFCPKGAMKVHRTIIARIINRQGTRK